MEILPIIIVVGMLAGVQALSVNLTTESPLEAFDEGLEVKITCSAELDTFDVLALRKRTPLSNFPVVTNQVAESAFRDTGRYTVEYTYFADKKTGTMELTITNFNKTDAGTYFCRLSSTKNEKDSEPRDLIVKVPVDDVRIARIRPNGTLEDVQDNDVVSLKYGTKGGIACIVSLKSYVNVPTVNVTVNGMASSDFTFSDVKAIEGNTLTTYEFIYKYMTSKPDYRIHGNPIECVASTQGDPQVSAKVKGEATFKPIITCEDIRPKVALDRDAAVTCTVYSHPHADISVEYGETFMDNKLGLDDNRNGKFEFTTLLGDLANRTVTFKVSSITEGLFTYYKYRIKAVSKLGTELKVFSFEEKYVSGSSLPSYSRSLLTIAIISSVLSLKSLSL